MSCIDPVLKLANAEDALIIVVYGTFYMLALMML